MDPLLSYREMEPNLSLYEDKLKFYFVTSDHDQQSMQFAQEVSGILYKFFYSMFHQWQKFKQNLLYS